MSKKIIAEERPKKYYLLGFLLLLIFVFNFIITGSAQAAVKQINLGPLVTDTSKIIMGIAGSQVGIGTDPGTTYKLNVNGDTNITGILNVTGSITGALNLTGALSSGNVSAGTFGSNTGGGNYTFPGVLNISGTNALYFSSYGGGFYMQDATWLRSSNSTSIWLGSGNFGTGGGVTVGYGGTTPPAGGGIFAENVGIGITNPGYKLDVQGGTVNSSGGFLWNGTSLDSRYLGISDTNILTSRSGVAEASLDTTTVNGYYTVSKTGHSSTVLGFNVGGSTGPVQIDANYFGLLRWRNKTDSTTWQSWRTLFNDGGTYTSNGYIPKVTNGGYGTLANSLIYDNGTNVGIGKNNPATALDVNGVVTATSFSGTYSGTIGAPNVSAGAFGANTGGGNYTFPANVGIGTTDPQGRLQIAGNFNNIGTGVQDGNDRPGLDITGYYPQMVLMAGGQGNSNHGSTISLGAFDSGTSGAFKSWTIGTPGINATWMDIGYGTSANPHLNGIAGYGTPVMRLTNAGNVGIGTTAPGQRLEVAGSILVNGNRPITISPGSITLKAESGGWSIPINFLGSANTVLGGFGAYGGNDSLSYLWAGSSFTSPTMVWANGNVGIGTTNPIRRLTIQGPDDYNVQLRLQGTGDSASYWELGRESASTGDFRLISNRTGVGIITALTIKDTNGNVGIGTNAPGVKLETFGSETNFTGLRIRNNTWECNQTASLDFWNGNGRSLPTSKIVTQMDTCGGDGDSLYFQNASTGGAAPTTKLIIKPSGNVGIGKINPATALDVNGTVTALGFSGPLSGSLSAANVSSGTFGSNTGGGNYHFPGNIYTDANYGYGLVGAYDSTKYQGIFSMGSSWALAADGSSPGNLYGLAWSYPNAGGVASNLNTHGLLVMENGTFLAAISGSIRARDDMRAPLFYDSNNTNYFVNPDGNSVINTVTANTFTGNLVGNASTADKVNGYGGTANTAHPGTGLKPFYQWGGSNCAGSYPSDSCYVNGLTVGSNPGDQAYGFQIAQNMWDDRLIFRRYNAGWQGWLTVIDSGNIGSQTVSNVTNLNGTWDGMNYFRTNKGATSYLGANDSYKLEAYSTDSGAAAMSFHRSGAYAVNFGLDPDNVMRIGGWSAAANRWQLDMSGNETLAGSLTATGAITVTSPATYAINPNGQRIGPISSSLDTDAASVAYVKAATLSYNAVGTADFTGIGNLNMNGKDIKAVNKLTVLIIDPLYNIGGTNYSTYVSAIAGGAKEEFVDKAKIVTKNTDGEYELVIDFDKQTVGSDLWVWRKTVDFSDENVQVLLTPSGRAAQVYYVISNNQLILKSDKPVAVSYRLIGRRVDWQQWPTKAVDQTEKASIVIK